jgi:hypothetical protein
MSTPLLVASVAPAIEASILKNAHLLENLTELGDVLLVPFYDGATDPQGPSTTCDTTWTAVRANRTPIATVIAGAVNNSAVPGDATDPAPDGTVADQVDYQVQPIVDFFVSGAATLSDVGAGTVISGAGTNHLRMVAAAGLCALRITTAVSGTYTLQHRVLNMPSLDVSKFVVAIVVP